MNLNWLDLRINLNSKLDQRLQFLYYCDLKELFWSRSSDILDFPKDCHKIVRFTKSLRDSQTIRTTK